MDRAKLVAIARELFERHGLISRGWRLRFRNYACRLGSCSSRRQIIALSAFYVDNNDEKLVLDTLLHEIAHALVGPHQGHGPVWKAMARKLGCIPKAFSKSGVKLPPGKFQATCPTCARLFNKHRKPKFKDGYYCPSCGKEKGRLAFTVKVSEKG
jgi:predicted SprT family Zn-dependent metalloprotease